MISVDSLLGLHTHSRQVMTDDYGAIAGANVLIIFVLNGDTRGCLFMATIRLAP